LHSYIPLLDRSIFIEKTNMMHLRFSFYIITDFSDPLFATLPIEILLRLALEKGKVIAKRKVDYQSAYD